jgi:hypothetical protein
MTQIYQAHPTMYAGTQFRSRLEARWAAFFDLVGWRWTYEPVDLCGWVPDFLLSGAEPIFVEVKPFCDPCEPLVAETQAKIERAYIRGRTKILLLGACLLVPDVGYASIGLLAESMYEMIPDDPFATGPHYYDWQHAVCVNQTAYDFRAEYGSYRYRITGGSNGGHPADADVEDIESLWRAAGNLVQWRSVRRPAS